MSLEELRRKIDENMDVALRNMGTIADESNRVADVAHNSKEIIENLECEFESATGLRGKDIVFLFAATGLQVARIVLMNLLTEVQNAGSGNRNEAALHKFQKKLLERFNSGGITGERPYYASLDHIITNLGVPYDATASLSKEAVERIMKNGHSFNFNLDSFIPSGKLHLFKGGNHRFSTLGHDPVLGLLFGTGNIMTNTITCTKSLGIKCGIEIPMLTTNHVIYTTDYSNPRIATYGSTSVMLKEVIERTKDQPSALVASLIKQIIHIGTDLYTPCGIQIPASNLILSTSNVEELTKSIISTGDIVKITASAKLSNLINLIISAIHTLMYDSSSGYSRSVYGVRTKKIIMYSNVIATTSNIIWVGGNMMVGNDTAVKQLDIGGLLVTVKRLINDSEYIRQIKNEFVLGGFNNMIQGDALELEETPWE